MISTSPMRYPGGKARFAQYIWEAIQASRERSEVFVEHFCGGAGVSLALLEKGSGSNSNAGVFCIVAVNEQHKAVEMHPLAF